MISVIHHQRTTNYNYNTILSHTHQDGYCQKQKQKTENSKPGQGCGETATRIPWGEQNGIATTENSMAFPQKIKKFCHMVQQPSLLGILPKRTKGRVSKRDLHTCFHSSIIHNTKREKQSKCIHQWINDFNVRNIHTMEYYSAL